MPIVETNKLKKKISGNAPLFCLCFFINFLLGIDKFHFRAKMWLEDEMEQEKIYGIYSAGLDEQKVENFQEWQFYSLIQQYGGSIFFMNHYVSDHIREMSPEECYKIDRKIDELQYRIEYLAAKLKRFGVDVGEPTAGKHISKGQNYWTWYEFWNHHFNSLSEEDFKEFNRRLANNEDITEFLPKTSWNAGLGA